MVNLEDIAISMVVFHPDRANDLLEALPLLSTIPRCAIIDLRGMNDHQPPLGNRATTDLRKCVPDCIKMHWKSMVRNPSPICAYIQLKPHVIFAAYRLLPLQTFRHDDGSSSSFVLPSFLEPYMQTKDRPPHQSCIIPARLFEHISLLKAPSPPRKGPATTMLETRTLSNFCL